MTDVKLKDVVFGIMITKTPWDGTNTVQSDTYKIDTFIGHGGFVPIIISSAEDEFYPNPSTGQGFKQDLPGDFIDREELKARRTFEYLGFPQDKFEVRRFLNVIKTQHVQEAVDSF